MAAKTLTVPRLPKRRVVIELQVQKKTEEWIARIKEMSPRLKVRPGINDKEYVEEILKSNFWKLHQGHGIGEKRSQVDIQDWPHIDQVALVVGIEMTPIPVGRLPEPKDTFVFCYNNFAFGLDFYHMGTDADIRQGYLWAFVLPNTPKGVTTWRGVVREIERRLKLAEQVVPAVE